MLMLGGGGYTIRNVARCWTYETSVALDTEISGGKIFFIFFFKCFTKKNVELPYNDYFEYYGPDFKLHISASNMTNHNTPEYLDKVKLVFFKCFTNLKFKNF